MSLSNDDEAQFCDHKMFGQFGPIQGCLDSLWVVFPRLWKDTKCVMIKGSYSLKNFVSADNIFIGDELYLLYACVCLVAASLINKSERTTTFTMACWFTWTPQTPEFVYGWMVNTFLHEYLRHDTIFLINSFPVQEILLGFYFSTPFSPPRESYFRSQEGCRWIS